MRILKREEVIEELVRELNTFEKIYQKNKNIIARVKNAPTQLQMFGLLPYITFLVSKYKVSGSDSAGYTGFLNFLIYMLKKLQLVNVDVNVDNVDEDKLSTGDYGLVKSFLEKINNINEAERKILERDLMIILEEMKKIYGGLFKEK